MKRLGSLFLFVCVALVLLASVVFAQPNTHDLQRKILQTVQIDKNALDIKIALALQQYYGRTDFSDPEHTSGWFRVDDFLKWVHENRKILSEEQVRLEPAISLDGYLIVMEKHKISLLDLFNSDQDYLFWAYLGARYVASKYNLQIDFKNLALTYCTTVGSCALSYGNYSDTFISLGVLDHQKAIPALINTGMHEATHMFPILMKKDLYPLFELATFYSQYNYGLPVKPNDITDCSDGIRDIRQTHKYRPDLDNDFVYEYHYFIVGILLNKLIHPKDILELNTKFRVGYRDPSIWEVAMSWVAIYNKKWFYDKETIDFLPDEAEATLRAAGLTGKEALECQGKNPGYTFDLGQVERTTTQFARIPDKWLYMTLMCQQNKDLLTIFYWPIPGIDFLQRRLPYYGRSNLDKLETLFSGVSKKTAKFYDKLIENLPPDLVAKIDAQWPRKVGKDFLEGKKMYTLKEITRGHEEDFAKAILAALEEVDAPPPPAIPEGYL